jgi:hypothetical protein
VEPYQFGHANNASEEMEDVMSRIRLIALVAMMVTGAAHLANAGQANTAAQVQAARANRSELSLMLAQERAANRWAVTDSGAHIQSRAGFVGYH